MSCTYLYVQSGTSGHKIRCVAGGQAERMLVLQTARCSILFGSCPTLLSCLGRKGWHNSMEAHSKIRVVSIWSWCLKIRRGSYHCNFGVDGAQGDFVQCTLKFSRHSTFSKVATLSQKICTPEVRQGNRYCVGSAGAWCCICFVFWKPRLTCDHHLGGLWRFHWLRVRKSAVARMQSYSSQKRFGRIQGCHCRLAGCPDSLALLIGRCRALTENVHAVYRKRQIFLSSHLIQPSDWATASNSLFEWRTNPLDIRALFKGLCITPLIFR